MWLYKSYSSYIHSLHIHVHAYTTCIQHRSYLIALVTPSPVGSYPFQFRSLILCQAFACNPFVSSIRLQPSCAKHSLATLLYQAFTCNHFVPSVRLQPSCAKRQLATLLCQAFACNPFVPSIRLQPFCAKCSLATLLCQASACNPLVPSVRLQ